MRTDAHDPPRVRDPAIESLLGHTRHLDRHGDSRRYGVRTICVQRNSAILRPVDSLVTTASQTCV